MFGFLNKKMDLSSVADGVLIPIEKVSDNVFSSKTMGDGFAIQPTNGEIYSPVEGTVTTVFPTKHAFGIKTNQGFEVLIHLGVDTVELEGAPFETYVNVNDEVTPDTKLVDMDLKAVEEAGKSTDLMIVFTNAENPDIKLDNVNNKVSAKDKIGEIKAKVK